MDNVTYAQLTLPSPRSYARNELPELLTLVFIADPDP